MGLRVVILCAFAFYVLHAVSAEGNPYKTEHCIKMTPKKEEEIDAMVTRITDFLNSIAEDYDDYDIRLVKIDIESHSENEVEEKYLKLQVSVNDCVEEKQLNPEEKVEEKDEEKDERDDVTTKSFEEPTNVTEQQVATRKSDVTETTKKITEPSTIQPKNYTSQLKNEDKNDTYEQNDINLENDITKLNDTNCQHDINTTNNDTNNQKETNKENDIKQSETTTQINTKPNEINKQNDKKVYQYDNIVDNAENERAPFETIWFFDVTDERNDKYDDGVLFNTFKDTQVQNPVMTQKYDLPYQQNEVIEKLTNFINKKKGRKHKDKVDINKQLLTMDKKPEVMNLDLTGMDDDIFDILGKRHARNPLLVYVDEKDDRKEYVFL